MLTETKLHNHLYTHQAFGYKVFASMAVASLQLHSEGGGPGERRQAELLSVLSFFHLSDVGQGFTQKPQVGTWTWSMWCGDTRI